MNDLFNYVDLGMRLRNVHSGWGDCIVVVVVVGITQKCKKNLKYWLFWISFRLNDARDLNVLGLLG